MSISAQDRERLIGSGRFDMAFYEENYRELFAPDQDAIDHFLTEGARQGLKPSARFDPVLYRIAHPDLGDGNALLDAIARGDNATYADAGTFVSQLAVDAAPLGLMLYKPEHRARFTANAQEIAGNVARPVVVPWQGNRYELRNPAPDEALTRIAGPRAVTFCRFTQGLWDCILNVKIVTDKLTANERCKSLPDRQRRNLAIRILAAAYPNHGAFVESMLDEIEADMRSNPSDDDFWTAIAFKGFPTHDETPLGYEHPGLDDRVAIFASYFSPQQTLYDATLWKRWVLSGDMARFVDTLRGFPVVLVGPAKFATLGEKWKLERYTHVQIPPARTQQIRHRVLGELVATVRRIAGGAKRPVVLFQCGSLSPWLIRRLRNRLPNVAYLDIGQALDLWYWNPDVLWMKVYKEAILRANPFAEVTESTRVPPRPPWAPGR